MDEIERDIHMIRREPARNMARFYRLSIERDLFGEALLVREWGRIGLNLQRKVERLHTRDAAIARLVRIEREKRGRGYRRIDDG